MSCGIGHVTIGISRATFYTTGMEHSLTSATGTGWERTLWHARKARHATHYEG